MFCGPSALSLSLPQTQPRPSLLFIYFFFFAIDAHHHVALICDAGHRSTLQFFMGRAQAKIMFSYSRVRNLKGAKVNNVRWCEPGGRVGAWGRQCGPECVAMGLVLRWQDDSVYQQLLMYAAVCSPVN